MGGGGGGRRGERCLNSERTNAVWSCHLVDYEFLHILKQVGSHKSWNCEQQQAYGPHEEF